MSIENRSASRAEARRRARLAARGDPSEPATAEPEPESRANRGGFLNRLFPPAPPLPNRPDPLAGFTGSGPLRPITMRLYLLRRNPLAWIVPSLAATVGLIASLSYATGFIGLVGTFLLFGSLIAAGWFGWQRPALFGVAAAVAAFLIATALSFLYFADRGAGPETFAGTSIILNSILGGLYQGALGFLGGWYGGYLRRRQTQLSAEQRPRQRRR